MRLALAIVAALLVLRGVPAFADSLLIENAQVTDPASRTIVPGHILIENGVIKSITARRPAGYSGRRLDAAGKWVIPGLVDMHVHAWGNSGPNSTEQYLGIELAARHMLYAGVTAFLDLFNAENEILKIRDQQRAERTVGGADIFASGPILTCTGGHGTEYDLPTRIIDTPEDAEREIADLARKKPDVIKIAYDHAWRMPTMDHLTMLSAVGAARKHGIKSIVHIGTWEDAQEAVLAGADAITHLYVQEIPGSLIKLLESHGTYLIPTMTAQVELANMAEFPNLLKAPLLTELVAPDVLSAYLDPITFDPTTQFFNGWQKLARPAHALSLSKLARSKVKVMTGTDAGNLGVFQGYSIHRELELLSEGGFSSWDLLAAASVVPGEFLGRRWGIRIGDEANLLILKDSPIDDIRNTKKMLTVIHHGQIIDLGSVLNIPEGKAR